ncbi:hypothetical protein [Albidovulum inexpectatum]|uniref:hypothetical protein n=1 Tax=Albidovulum inexpectatum TaxID=196587 RepID=UPI0011B0A5EE|nr:hypothetical protein [Albidovulum inexpectatum]
MASAFARYGLRDAAGAAMCLRLVALPMAPPDLSCMEFPLGNHGCRVGGRDRSMGIHGTGGTESGRTGESPGVFARIRPDYRGLQSLIGRTSMALTARSAGFDAKIWDFMEPFEVRSVRAICSKFLIDMRIIMCWSMDVRGIFLSIHSISAFSTACCRKDFC